MRKSVLTAVGAVGAAAAAALAYSAAVEPYDIRIEHIELTTPRLPQAFDGYTIYQLSDFHMRQMGRRERKIRAILDALPPADLIVLTGDLIHTRAGTEPFFELAKSFQSRDGAFSIFGNSEHKNGVRPGLFAAQLAGHGLHPLLNAHTTIERGGETIVLAGVDDPVNDLDRLPDALAGAPAGAFVLLMMHSPDSIAEAVVHGVDVVLSGHTHGGQIRFPFVGAPYTHSLFGKQMSSGYYGGYKLRKVIGIAPGRTQLYVTRGLGVSGLALRFLTPPELTIVTLRRGAPHFQKLANLTVPIGEQGRNR
ncbi:MAG: Ser/Thr protein phosphatase family protein [Capsulimonas sp.]|nr:Ser/Thr protein phosphatase family protein [Capsulimonas sp.]